MKSQATGPRGNFGTESEAGEDGQPACGAVQNQILHSNMLLPKARSTESPTGSQKDLERHMDGGAGEDGVMAARKKAHSLLALWPAPVPRLEWFETSNRR